jgi:hypothetical protein
MGDTVHPGPQAATSIKQIKTSPNSNVNLLQQITPAIGIGLIAPREPTERWPVCLDCFPVQPILLVQRRFGLYLR